MNNRKQGTKEERRTFQILAKKLYSQMSAFLLSVISKDILQISIVIRWVVISLFYYMFFYFWAEVRLFLADKTCEMFHNHLQPYETTEQTQPLPTRL